jgi:metal-sulfur cluster biosynthetic enzyme
VDDVATEEEIRSAMKQVEDPELGVNVVDLGLLYGVSQDDEGNVVLNMTLTSMGCPLTEQIQSDARAALEPLDGVRSVEINWVWDPPWTPDSMTEEGRFLMKVMGYG